LDELLLPYFAKYFISGEHNAKVNNVKDKLMEIQNKYSNFKVDTLDGVSVEADEWRANVRGSNTEPLLRLNVEAKTKELVEAKTKELLDFIQA
jgi:phosphomannomutase